MIRKRIVKTVTLTIMLALICSILSGCKSSDYKAANQLLDSGNYIEAKEEFIALGDYKDSAEKAKEAQLLYARELCDSGKYLEASEAFMVLGDYGNAIEGANEAQRLYAIELCDSGKYSDSIAILVEIEDYAPAKETLNDVRIAYGQDLLQEKEYKRALQVFKCCEENEILKTILDDVAQELISAGDYKSAHGFLYLHNTSEDWMRDFLYQYLTWQMDNHDYTDTVTTFKEIQGYKDTMTSDKFAGARLMSMNKVEWDKSEANIWSGGSVLTLSLSFDSRRLNFRVYGGTISFITYQMTNNVDVSDSWEFYFEGKNIFVKDGENYIKGGTIGSFKPASGGTKDSVTLSLNLPGMMTVKNSVFEKVG